MYILSQVCAILSTLVLISYSAIKVGRKVILIGGLISNILTSLHYIFLQDFAGGSCTFICVFMVFTYYFKNVKWLRKFYTPLFFAVILSIATILTWKDAWSLIPLIGHLILAVALWQDSESVIKACIAFVLLLWVIYSIHLNSIANVIGQGVAMMFNLAYFVRLNFQHKKETKGE
jgi:hypothetical protein